MDKIQRVLIKAGRRDLAQKYYLKIAVKSFQSWLRGKKFINLETKERTDYESLPDKQKKAIKDKYDEYVKSVPKKKYPKKEKLKAMTKRQVEKLGRDIAQDLKGDGFDLEGDAAYDVALNMIQTDLELRQYFINKKITNERQMASAFADYIPTHI